VVGLAAPAASMAGVDELIVLAVAGGAVSLGRAAVHRAPPAAVWAPLPRVGATGGAAAGAATAVGLGPLCPVFLKIGPVLFGSGYVLLAFLRSDRVEYLYWLTEAQLLDAIAVGQVTPGPVFNTATFVGYVLGGARRHGGRHARHLPAGLRVRRDQRAAGGPDPTVADRQRSDRWGQRRVARADGGGRARAGARGDRRRAHRHDRRRACGRAARFRIDWRGWCSAVRRSGPRSATALGERRLPITRQRERGRLTTASASDTVARSSTCDRPRVVAAVTSPRGTAGLRYTYDTRRAASGGAS